MLSQEVLDFFVTDSPTHQPPIWSQRLRILCGMELDDIFLYFDINKIVIKEISELSGGNGMINF